MDNKNGTIPLAEASFPLFVGIDVGGTSIKLGLVDDEGSQLAFDRIETGAKGPAEEASQRMGEAVRHLIESVGATPGQVPRVGLATPGPLDLKTGYLLGPGNLPGWWDFPIRDRVSHHCGIPVTFANDANAAAYGEYWRGAGRQHNSMVLLTLGTGVGGGIIVGDLLIEGEHGCGSECGHVIVDPRPDARIDSLNKTGSLEAYCGAYGVVARTKEALAAGRKSLLSKVGDDLSPLEIAQAAEQGDELAREIIFETAGYLAVGIATLIHAIDPNIVVLGGAMTFGGAGHVLGEEFRAAIHKEVTPRLLEPLREKLLIEFATLEGDAGFIGAAGLARRNK